VEIFRNFNKKACPLEYEFFRGFAEFFKETKENKKAGLNNGVLAAVTKQLNQTGVLFSE